LVLLVATLTTVVHGQDATNATVVPTPTAVTPTTIAPTITPRVLPKPVELEPKEEEKRVTRSTLLFTLVGVVFVLAILFTIGRKLPLSRRSGYQDIPTRVGMH
jgi:MFS superfamily sulfate permease-like transporter